MSPSRLQEICDKHRQEAIRAMKSKRNDDYDSPDDKYIAEVEKV
jgi:hypothetical protein